MASPLKTPLGFNPIPSIPAPVAPIEAAPSGLLDQVKGAFSKVTQFRDSLNLPNPGTYEGVNREVKRTSEALYPYYSLLCGRTLPISCPSIDHPLERKKTQL